MNTCLTIGITTFGNKISFDVINFLKGQPINVIISENKEDLDTFTNYISRIRKAILKETNDNYAEELFGVEGKKKDNYGIAGATDENRDVVRKEFRIE